MSRGPGYIQRQLLRLLDEHEAWRVTLPRSVDKDGRVEYSEHGRIIGSGLYPAELAGMVFGDYTEANYSAVLRACKTLYLRDLIEARHSWVADIGVWSYAALGATGWTVPDRTLIRRSRAQRELEARQRERAERQREIDARPRNVTPPQESVVSVVSCPCCGRPYAYDPAEGGTE